MTGENRDFCFFSRAVRLTKTQTRQEDEVTQCLHKIIFGDFQVS